MNDFITNENKGLLWGILQNGGKFNNLPTQFNIQRAFESHVSKIATNGNRNTPLIALNKQFISSFVNELSRYASPDVIKKQKVDSFNNTLKEKENAFKETMAVPLPKEVDFSDKREDKPIDNMDDLLAIQMEKRKLDVPVISNTNQSEVQDWINGTTSSMPNMNNNDNFPKNIKIGESIKDGTFENSVINITPEVKEPPKQVKWADQARKPLPNLENINPTINNSTISNSKIEEALIKILKQQEYIINAIHDLQDRI